MENVENSGGSSREELRAENRELVELVGSKLHEVWQRQFRADHPDQTTRFKLTTDAAWAMHNGLDRERPDEWRVDLLNTPFTNLPADWKKENQAAADMVVALVEQEVASAPAGGAVQFSEEFIEQASVIVHNEFRNRRLVAQLPIPESQDRPYAELSDADKELDRNQVRLAIRMWQEKVG